MSHRLEEVDACLERLAVAREHVFVPGNHDLERAWHPAVGDRSVHAAPDLVIHGHKHTRYVAGDAVCWALGYPGQAETLSAFGDSPFAAIDLVRPTR